MAITAIIDNGHGSDTPGKCSPDRSLFEWAWNREIAQRVVEELTKRGNNAVLLVPENNDISLGDRVVRVNAICAHYGAQKCVLVSVHCNAASNDGQWHNATGISFWTSPGETKADALADCLHVSAVPLCKRYNKKILTEKYKDGDIDYEANFAVLTRTKCPACLVENWFMDNHADVDWLLSDIGKQTAVDIIVNGITLYIQRYDQ